MSSYLNTSFLKEGLEEFFMEKEFYLDDKEVVCSWMDELEKEGISFNSDEDIFSSEFVVLLAELCNISAKDYDEKFYQGKVELAAMAATMEGVISGWDHNSGCFVLYTEATGAVHLHDPFCHLWDRLEARDPSLNKGIWTHGWSGVRRQWAAEWILTNKEVRSMYARLTSIKRKTILCEADAERLLKRLGLLNS